MQQEIIKLRNNVCLEKDDNKQNMRYRVFNALQFSIYTSP